MITLLKTTEEKKKHRFRMLSYLYFSKNSTQKKKRRVEKTFCGRISVVDLFE